MGTAVTLFSENKIRVNDQGMKAYKNTYYQDRNAATRHSAQTILSILLELFPAIHSATDLGCGVGAWLAAAREKGIQDIQGFDGKWVNQDMLVIPRERFQVANLNEPIAVTRRFDLAISLEVAEHLPPQCAESFVNSLTSLSNIVLFSAAVPQQGGRNHFNEQWPEYWAKFFEDRGFCVLDLIRKRIWHDDNIPYWYRQNIFLYVKKDAFDIQKLISLSPMAGPLSVVHPQLYLNKNAETLKEGWTHFRRSIRSSFRRMF